MLRKNGKIIPIIALTAGTVKEEIEKCFEAGMSNYASKPIILGTFAKLLTKWIPEMNLTNVSST